MILSRSIGDERFIFQMCVHEVFCDQYGYTDNPTQLIIQLNALRDTFFLRC